MSNRNDVPLYLILKQEREERYKAQERETMRARVYPQYDHSNPRETKQVAQRGVTTIDYSI